MNPRPGRVQPRKTAAQQRSYQTYSLPGPSLGWVSNQNLATPQPGGAAQLDNIFPTATGGRLRRGRRAFAEVGAPVLTLFSYVQGNTSELFAATDEDIFLVTDGGAPVSKLSITQGRISVAKYVNTDGLLYIRGVNGEDTPWIYSGTTFGTSPALTFPGGDTTTPSDLSFVWVFKDRFFFIKKNSLDVYYLTVGTLGGALTKLPLGGVFPSGGSLVFGGTWSQETGNGLSSMCVFMTDQGEVAVFQGSNPSDAANWSRVGVYKVGKPLGPRSVVQRGGDLAICTDIGLVALSQALLRDAEALSPTAMSRPIEPDWINYVANRPERSWAAIAWTEGQMLAVALPTLSGQSPVWLVSNASTGKWARYTAWSAACLETFLGGLYFGSLDGFVYQAEVTGSDDGSPYTGVCVTLFDQLGVMGQKTAHKARVVMRTRFPVKEKLNINADYIIRLPTPPEASPVTSADVWGSAIWGEATWGGGDAKIQSQWRAVYGEGEALSVGVQITSGSTAPVDTEIIRTDVMFTSGEPQS